VDNYSIQCVNLGKCFRIYNKPHDRLLESLLRPIGWFAENQHRRSREFWALRHISFSVSPGETVAIIGLNGSGKSTLLQLIAGTLNPTEGEVRVNGRISALLELGAGFNGEFSGMENAKISAAVLGLTPDEIELRLPEILAFADIGDFIHQPVKTYSSGMYVRLAFAIAIHADPDILVVDEALSVGDMAFQNKCMARIRRFQQEGKTLLFVSHDINTVRALCDRTLYLEHGRMVEFGPTASVVDRYIHDVHSDIDNDTQASFTSDNPHLPPLPESGNLDMKGRYDHFLNQLQGQRQGTGQACIRLVELVGENGKPLELAEFDSVASVRIWVECFQPCIVSVNYKIRNKLLIAVAGADFLITGQPLLEMKAGQTYRVEYTGKLALMDGAYSIRASVTIPIAKHEQAVFVDIIEICCPFKVLPSQLGKIYTYTYLPNTVAITPLFNQINNDKFL
jgi:lipopolysaccharide transport system ATP-binding protein